VESTKSTAPRPGHVKSLKPISLKELASRLSLSPTALSLVLNGSPAARSIPKSTQDLIFAAAKKFNYRPNLLARSLRVRRTFAVGVLMPELSEGYASLVLAGIEEFLSSAGYMYLATSHHHQEKKIVEDTSLLWERGVEGIIVVDTPLSLVPQWLQMISVFGHERIPGATNVILNHDAAAHLGLQHLMELGHREIAVIKGQSVSSDSEVRFQSILSAAAKLGLSIPAPRVVQMEGNSPSPEIGYRAARELLERGASFTALFSFNDIAAMGAMRAFQDAGFRVPLDVSVVGFDDVPGAAYHTPSLTTIHQPLRKMGMIAAETLIKRLGAETEKSPEFIEVEPDLRIRESTGPAPIANAKRPSR
jgi:DNA-binding LacI/PurR family transcriptional regulator